MRSRIRRRLSSQRSPWPWPAALLSLFAASSAPAASRADAPPAPAPAPDPKLDPAEQARRAQVVARFEGGQITLGELEDAITGSSPFTQQRYLDQAALKSLLDRSLRFELLAAEAARRGYDKNPSVVQAVKQNAVQSMIKREIDDKITPQSVPAEAVKKYYEAHIDEFVRPEMRRASQIVLASEAEAKALLAEAKAGDMRAFRELARLKSQDLTSQQRGGDLRYFDRNGRPDEGGANLDPTVAKAVFALKTVGDTSDVVQTAQGFAIFRLTGLRPAHEDSPKEAEERIRLRLWREQREAAIDAMLVELKKEQKPEVHPELLDTITFDASAPTPPAQGLPSGFPHTRPPPVPTPRE